MPIFPREHIQFHSTYCEQVCHCFLGWVGFSEQEISGLKLRTVWGNWGKMMLSECNRAFGSLRCYRKNRALCVFLTPSAVLLILAILAVPEAITDQRAALSEDAGIAGRFGNHCGERQKSHEHRTSAGLPDDQQYPSKAVNLNVANTGE